MKLNKCEYVVVLTFRGNTRIYERPHKMVAVDGKIEDKLEVISFPEFWLISPNNHFS